VQSASDILPSRDRTHNLMNTMFGSVACPPQDDWKQGKVRSARTYRVRQSTHARTHVHVCMHAYMQIDRRILTAGHVSTPTVPCGSLAAAPLRACRVHRARHWLRSKPVPLSAPVHPWLWLCVVAIGETGIKLPVVSTPYQRRKGKMGVKVGEVGGWG